MIDFANFLEQVSEILEVELSQLHVDFHLHNDTPYWDSLKGFSLLILLRDTYHTKLSVEKFLTIDTVGDLYKQIPENTV